MSTGAVTKQAYGLTGPDASLSVITPVKPIATATMAAPNASTGSDTFSARPA